VHSFVGTKAQVQKLIGLGLDISVNGFSFQSRDSVEMVAALPLDRLHLETDAPWGEVKATSELFKRYCVNAPALPPSKKRDKWDPECMVKERNESCAITLIAFIVAGLKGVPVEEVSVAAWTNFVRLFPLVEA
jgi:TatD DNase family protein